MKKAILPFLLAFYTAIAFAQTTPSNVILQDNAKVGVIVTGTGNTINTTQIFGKSPEYAELKKHLADLAAAITKKADKCEKYTDPLAKEDCRAELIALNAERDSVQKIETRFREDVIRLAETFSCIEINSERLRLAKQLFEEGKIREADNVLNEREMKVEGDALLAEKAREQEKLLRTDSLLRIKADEFALKARLKATDYGDSLRYNSAVIYFEQSRRYAETVDYLIDFAILLCQENRSDLSISYYERALNLSPNEIQEAAIANNLGQAYQVTNNVIDAEKMFLRSYKIRERLATIYPARFNSDFATTAINLGNLYRILQRVSEAEAFYLNALKIYETLSCVDPSQFEPGLARTAMNLAALYLKLHRMPESEALYLHSLEIRERLSKSNPAQYDSDLAVTALNLGSFYLTVRRMPESETMYLRALEIYERLSKANPAQFEPRVARTAFGMAILYQTEQKMPESEKMYCRSLEIYERMAKANPKQFELDLANTILGLANVYFSISKMQEAEKMYCRSLEIYERIAEINPALAEPELAKIHASLGNLYQNDGRIPEAETMYRRSLNLYERVVEKNPREHEQDFAFMLTNYGWFKQITGQLEESMIVYSQGLKLRQKAVLRGENYFLSELWHVHISMACLRDSFESRKNYAMVIAIQIERAACMDSLRNIEAQATKNAPQEYGSLSWYSLLARQYTESQAAAERALTLDPSQNFVRTNLGHSYLLQGNWDKAKSLYEEYILEAPDPSEAKNILAKDWETLEAAGITCLEMAKARVWLKG